ncbi:MAG: hypothetical protein AAF519_14415 [Bacteroidota bacterium]
MKKLLYTIFALPILILAAYFALNERLPYGETGPEAEALANKMLNAVNIQGWDSIAVLQWTFRDAHHFLWDKRRNLVQVQWENKRVLLDPSSKDGLAWVDGRPIESQESKRELIRTAWSHFANDSFWFSAPFKVRDPGTERRLVKSKNNNALLVTYSQGGVTPGDSYLWILDKNGLPESWKMWVTILPIGGLQFTWEDWKKYEYNTMISTKHLGVVDVHITQLKTANHVEQLANGQDPFLEWVKK